MALLDPFYGVHGFGRWAARWLNRILLAAELAAVGYGAYLEYIYKFHGYWIYILYFPLCLVAISLFNKLIRGFWNVIMVILHGTTDSEELQEMEEKREQRRFFLASLARELGKRKKARKEAKERRIILLEEEKAKAAYMREYITRMNAIPERHYTMEEAAKVNSDSYRGPDKPVPVIAEWTDELDARKREWRKEFENADPERRKELLLKYRD